MGGCCGLIHLQFVFVGERDNAREGLNRQRIALSGYAESVLKQKLTEKFSRYSNQIDLAAEDVLISDLSLYLSRNGDQLLPRNNNFSEVNSTVWIEEFENLLVPSTTLVEQAASPWFEIRQKYNELNVVLKNYEKSQTVVKVREILSLLANYSLDERRELVVILALLDRMSRVSKPDTQFCSFVNS